MSEVRRKGTHKILSRGGKAKMKDASIRAISDVDEVGTEISKRGKHKKSMKLFQSKKGLKASKTKDKSKMELTESDTETKSLSRKSAMKRIRHKIIPRKIRKRLSIKKSKGSLRSTKSAELSNLNTSADETVSGSLHSPLSVASEQPKLSSSPPPLEPVAEKSFRNMSGSGGSNIKTSNYSATLPPTDATLSLTSKSGSDTSDEPTSTQSISQQTQSAIPTDMSNSDVLTSNSSRNADAAISLAGKSKNDSVDEPTSTQITSQQTLSTTDIPLLPIKISNTGDGEDGQYDNDASSLRDQHCHATSTNVSNDEVNSTTSSVFSVPVIDQMEILDTIAPRSTKTSIQDSPASSVFVAKDDQDSYAGSVFAGEDDQNSHASSVFMAKDDAEFTTSRKGSEYIDIDQVQVQETLSRLETKASTDLQTNGKDATSSGANDQMSLEETVPPLVSKCDNDEEDAFLKYYSNMDEYGTAKQTLFRHLISCCFSGIEGHKKGLITTIEGHKKGLITDEDNYLENEITDDDNL